MSKVKVKAIPFVLSQELIAELKEAVKSNPRGLIGPQPKGANPASEWIARLVRRLGKAATHDGIWNPEEFRAAMLTIAGCAIAAILWVDKHYMKKENNLG